MVDETNVTITEESIDVSLGQVQVENHSARHKQGGVDELDLDTLNVAGTVDLQSNDLADGNQTIWDTSEQVVPSSALPDAITTGVQSFEGRTGTVVSQAGDYDHSEISNISSDDHHVKTQPTDVDSANWGDRELQKDGTSGQGIINFITT